MGFRVLEPSEFIGFGGMGDLEGRKGQWSWLRSFCFFVLQNFVSRVWGFLGEVLGVSGLGQMPELAGGLCVPEPMSLNLNHTALNPLQP